MQERMKESITRLTLTSAREKTQRSQGGKEGKREKAVEAIFPKGGTDWDRGVIYQLFAEIKSYWQKGKGVGGLRKAKFAVGRNLEISTR